MAFDDLPTLEVRWGDATRIVRGDASPLKVFDDIADPVDWALLSSATQKTNPRLMETIGTLDLVPPERRLAGQGRQLDYHWNGERVDMFRDLTNSAVYRIIS